MTVLIAAGSTGGHLFPGLSLARYVQAFKETDKIVLLVSQQAQHILETLPSYDIEYVYMPVIRLRRTHMLLFIKNIIKAFKLSFALIKKYKPDVVVGFGSYVSFAAVITAWIKKIPVIIHEQNAQFGMTNRFLSFFADSVAFSFPPPRKYRIKKYKSIYSGNLLRPEIFIASKKQSGREELPVTNKFVISILGGSQGARVINDVVPKMLELFSADERKKFFLYHISGKDGQKSVTAAYEKLGVEHSVFSFYNDVETIYEKTHLVISRAGAGTIWELITFGIPSILIPYPYAHRHQYRNASFLTSHGGAIMLSQEDLTPEKLKNNVQAIINNNTLRCRMHAQCSLLAKPDAAERLGQEVISMIKRRKGQKTQL